MAGETTDQRTSGLPLYLPKGSEEACRRKTFEITTDELELADVIATMTIPKGALITDGYLATDDLDSNGTPLLTLEVGTTDDDDGYLAANTVGRAGGLARFDGAELRDGTTLTADTRIDVKVGAAAATAQAGTVTLCVKYINGDDALD